MRIYSDRWSARPIGDRPGNGVHMPLSLGVPTIIVPLSCIDGSSIIYRIRVA